MYQMSYLTKSCPVIKAYIYYVHVRTSSFVFEGFLVCTQQMMCSCVSVVVAIVVRHLCI